VRTIPESELIPVFFVVGFVFVCYTKINDIKNKFSSQIIALIKKHVGDRMVNYFMNTDQLLYFLEAYWQKSMTKASNNLYITPPSMHSSINNLEKELGVKLFERSSSGLEPTMEGKLFYQTAQRIINELADYKLAVGPHENNRINIAVYKSFPAKNLQNIYDILSQNFFEYIFNIFSTSGTADFSSVLSQQNENIDIYIFQSNIKNINEVRTVYKIPELYECRLVKTVSTQLLMSKKHSLAKCKVIFPEKLIKFPIIFQTSRTSATNAQKFIKDLLGNDAKKINLYLTETESIYYDFLRRKEGIALVHEFGMETEYKDLIIHPLDGAKEHFIYIAYNPETATSFYPTLADTFYVM